MDRHKCTQVKGFIKEVVHMTTVAEKFHGIRYTNQRLQEAGIVGLPTSKGIKTGEDDSVYLRIQEVTTLSPGLLETWSADITTKEGNVIRAWVKR